MEFTIISAPKISYITPEKIKKVTLKKYRQKERLPGLSMPTLYFFQQETGEKSPFSIKTYHNSGLAGQVCLEEHFSL